MTTVRVGLNDTPGHCAQWPCHGGRAAELPSSPSAAVAAGQGERGDGGVIQSDPTAAPAAGAANVGGELQMHLCSEPNELPIVPVGLNDRVRGRY